MEYRDPFADISDEALRDFEEPAVSDYKPEYGADRYAKYQFSQYDWEAPGYVPNFIAVPLRGKYDLFLATDDLGYRRMLEINSNWYANIQKRKDTCEVSAIYAWTYKGVRRKSRAYYAHRVAAGAIDHQGPVDHGNRDTLDNRSSNVAAVGEGANRSNACRVRSSGLLPGLEFRNDSRSLVGAAIRTPDGQRLRSKCWPVEEEVLAHQWYAEKQKEFYGCGPLVKKPEPLRLPPLRKTRASISVSSLEMTF